MILFGAGPMSHLPALFRYSDKLAIFIVCQLPLFFDSAAGRVL